MLTKDDIRIDKFLWAVRIYKTRTQASDACSKGQVTINGMTVKPSRHVKAGETLMVHKPPLVRTFAIVALLGNRVSAQKVNEYIEDITPHEELIKLEASRFQRNAVRNRGAGRPTKRERRDIDRFIDDV